MKTYKRKMVLPLLFLVIMLLITFFSRTIYHSLMPNVETGHISSGTLLFHYVMDDYSIEDENYHSVTLGYNLPAKLEIDQVFVSKNQKVSAGTPLLQFQQASGETVLRQVRIQREEADIKKRDWSIGYKAALEEAKESVKEATTKVKRELAENKLKMLEDGIWQATSSDIIEDEYQLAVAAENAVLALKNNNWEITAPFDAWVQELRVSKGDEYEGDKTLITLIPKAGSASEVIISISDFTASITDEWNIKACIRTGSKRYDAHVVSTRREGRNILLKLQPDNAWSDEAFSQIEVALSSPYEPILIDNQLIHDGNCYTIDERTGAWGQTEYYAKKTSITLGDTDGKRTIVRSGLNAESLLIVSSTQELHDGMTVVLADP